MENKVNKSETLTSDILIADIMLRLTAIEKMLIDKNVLTKEELLSTTQEIAKSVAKVILEKAQSSKNVDDFMQNLEKPQSPKDNSN